MELQIKKVGEAEEYESISANGEIYDLDRSDYKGIKVVSDNKVYNIRRLTPRECGRLMGVDDNDISKMMSVNSDTQCYKQFGNSIVVDVMCAMFERMLP